MPARESQLDLRLAARVSPYDSRMDYWLNAPLRVWRHPNGKPLYFVAMSMAALYAHWLFTSLVLLGIGFMLWTLFGDH